MPAPPDRSDQSKHFWIFGRFRASIFGFLDFWSVQSKQRGFLDFQAPRLADAAEGGEAEEGWQQGSQGRKLAGF